MKTLVAMAALAALIASPALAQTATQRARAQQYQSQANQANQVQSYDRAIGHERTCGFAEYQYDSEGTPVGPYCH